jgi:hypothetical protein
MIIDDVVNYLVAEVAGVTLVLGTNLFKSYMPDTPNPCVVVYDTGGAEPDRYLPTAMPTFQVLVRSDDYEEAHNLIQEIADLLHNKYNIELVAGQTYFYAINLLGEPANIGRNDKNLDEFSANFICRIRR